MRAMRLAGIGGAIALGACCSASGALAAEIAFEGEAMAPSSEHVRVVEDDAASGGRALEFLNNDRASRSFTSAAGSARVLLRLRGDQCGDPPQPRVAVELDDPANRIWVSAVAATDRYALYEGFVQIPPGEHTLFVHMTNDYSQDGGLFRARCSRNLTLDRVALEDMPAMFAAESYRNAPLAANAPIDPLSSRYRDALIAHLDGLDPSDGYQRGVNTDSWSTPVYVVPAHQRRVRVQVDSPLLQTLRGYDVDALAEQWESVPLPAGAQPADAGRNRDNHLVVYQPETDTMWEFFKFGYSPLSGAPRARFGGRITEVSRSPGHFTGPDDDPPGPGTAYGASATSIPLLAGLQRLDELRRGSIDHVVSFHVPNIKEDFCRWPAQRSDVVGEDEDIPADVPPLPEGIRFRLPPALDVAAIPGMTDYGRMVARAVQRYGMVLTDGGSNFAFEAEDSTRFAGDPYDALLGPSGDRWGADGVLRNFPWQHLQALADAAPQPGRCPLDAAEFYSP